MGQIAKTVMIVDDSSEIRKELSEEFTFHGFTVCAEAENGKKAIEHARNYLPSLVILDLAMPVMNGLDAAPELRKLLPTSPIVLYTAYADALSTADIGNKGVTKVFPKNEPVAELVLLADRLLQGQDA